VRNTVAAFLVLAATLGIAVPSAHAQPTVVKAEVLKDWTGLKDIMMKIADAMPEDKFVYRSTPAQRSYGEQILHVANINLAVLASIGGKAPAPTINPKATAKAEILKAMSDSFDYGTTLINEQTPDTIFQVVKARFLGESTRSRAFYFLAGHTWDIYGQMAVYLRLNGIVPPASVRP
jgi:hypothetical protein